MISFLKTGTSPVFRNYVGIHIIILMASFISTIYYMPGIILTYIIFAFIQLYNNLMREVSQLSGGKQCA